MVYQMASYVLALVRPTLKNMRVINQQELISISLNSATFAIPLAPLVKGGTRKVFVASL